MKITRTVNADKRYYIDETEIVNQDSILDTISKFNDMKIQLYNALYDSKFLGLDPFSGKTYSAWLKEKFGTNDYYNCAVYTFASGQVSSQKELNKLYIKTMERDLQTRDAKINTTVHTLENKRKLKESIRTYLCTGTWKTPYPFCQVKVKGQKVELPGKKEFLLEDYERKIESDIRKLKTSVALLKEARKRAEAKLNARKSHHPRRIVFGTRDMYAEKDKEYTDIDVWKKEFRDARHASMSLPGRHTSKNCNFLVRLAGTDLIVKCMDGKEAVFHNFRLSREHETLVEFLRRKKEDRKPVCYNFQVRRDNKGRQYFIVSVTLELENNRCNGYFGEGCISMDLNYDHVALSNIDKDGNRIEGTVFRFNPEARTSGQITEDIGRMMAKVGKYCSDRKKPLVMEDIDTTISKCGMKYGNPKRNAHASVFAYRKMTACIENQSYKQGFEIVKINPAYTSQIGKFLYMRPLGLSIHEAASYVIGLKGMNLTEKIKPDSRMISLLPKKMNKILSSDPGMDDLMKAWDKIRKSFHGVRTHCFFRGVPFHVLNDAKNASKKRKTLTMLADEMRNWTVAYES